MSRGTTVTQLTAKAGRSRHIKCNKHVYPFRRRKAAELMREKGKVTTMSVQITQANFDDKVMQSDKPVLLDFWAPWCGPCRMVGPVIDKLAGDFEGKALVGKVNVDEETELAQRFRVMSIPTLCIMKNGEVVERVVGARSEGELTSLLKKYTG